MLLLCQGRFLLPSFSLYARVLRKSRWAMSLCATCQVLCTHGAIWCSCCLPRTLRPAWHCVQCSGEGRSCILFLEAVFCLPSPCPFPGLAREPDAHRVVVLCQHSFKGLHTPSAFQWHLSVEPSGSSARDTGADATWTPQQAHKAALSGTAGLEEGEEVAVGLQAS